MYLIISACVWLLLYAMVRQSRKVVAPVAAGSYRLRLPKFYLYLAGVVLAVSLCALAMPWLAGEFSLGISLTAGLLAAAFAGGGASLYLWYHNHQLTFDENLVSTTSTYGRTASLPWAEVVEAAYQPFAGQLLLRSITGETVRAHAHLVGFATFAAAVARQQARYRFAYKQRPPA